MRLVIVFGPPAVGKMTVGRELARRLGWRMVHNHLTIEPLLEVFDYGTPPFQRLLEEFRRRILQEAIAAGLPGLILTFVLDLESVADAALLQSYVDLVAADGGDTSFVELVAPLAVRQQRNNTEQRLAAKPSKRDRAFNDANLLALERFTMSTGSGPTAMDELLARHPHLVVDNSDLPATVVAAQVAEWLGAGRPSGGVG